MNRFTMKNRRRMLFGTYFLIFGIFWCVITFRAILPNLLNPYADYPRVLWIFPVIGVVTFSIGVWILVVFFMDVIKSRNAESSPQPYTSPPYPDRYQNGSSPYTGSYETGSPPYAGLYGNSSAPQYSGRSAAMEEGLPEFERVHDIRDVSYGAAKNMVPADRPACPWCGAPVEQGHRFCRRCGREIS